MPAPGRRAWLDGEIDEVTGGDFERSLKNINLLGGLAPEELERVEEMCQWHEYPPRRVVVDRSDATTDVYFIVRGTVQILDFVRGGREITLATMTEGETFGELSAVDQKKRSARVMTEDATVLASLPAPAFREILAGSPDVALTLLTRFAGLIRSLTAKVTALSSLSPHQRVYMELLRLSEPNPVGDGSWIISQIPRHEQIAEQVGTEQQVVAMAIGELARAKIVERKYRSLVIRDYSRLQMLSSM